MDNEVTGASAVVLCTAVLILEVPSRCAAVVADPNRLLTCQVSDVSSELALSVRLDLEVYLVSMARLDVQASVSKLTIPSGVSSILLTADVIQIY